MMSIRIVLVGTTHPGNIGAVARAMKNMGLRELYLVNPRTFPHEDATARASGATDILENATIVSSLELAITQCVYVVGASARSRTIEVPAAGARECARQLLLENEDGDVAAVFGPENSGLNNNDLDLCHTLLSIPTDPDFSSLNLAMAVQIITYELRVASMAAGARTAESAAPTAAKATAEEMELFFEHLKRVLTDVRFLDPDNPRYLMRRLRRLFNRARVDKNEANILRGMLSAIDQIQDTDTRAAK